MSKKEKDYEKLLFLRKIKTSDNDIVCVDMLPRAACGSLEPVVNISGVFWKGKIKYKK